MRFLSHLAERALASLLWLFLPVLAMKRDPGAQANDVSWRLIALQSFANLAIIGAFAWAALTGAWLAATILAALFVFLAIERWLVTRFVRRFLSAAAKRSTSA